MKTLILLDKEATSLPKVSTQVPFHGRKWNHSPASLHQRCRFARPKVKRASYQKKRNSFLVELRNRKGKTRKVVYGVYGKRSVPTVPGYHHFLVDFCLPSPREPTSLVARSDTFGEAKAGEAADLRSYKAGEARVVIDSAFPRRCDSKKKQGRTFFQQAVVPAKEWCVAHKQSSHSLEQSIRVEDTFPPNRNLE